MPGGGLSPDGTRWVSCRPGFFLPVRPLSQLFRGKFLTRLSGLHIARAADAGEGRFSTCGCRTRFAEWLRELRRTDWVVYAKPPFGGPEQVLKYLARYTHRVAISNHRLVGRRPGRWRSGGRTTPTGTLAKTMTLDGVEFLRRFTCIARAPVAVSSGSATSGSWPTGAGTRSWPGAEALLGQAPPAARPMGRRVARIVRDLLRTMTTRSPHAAPIAQVVPGLRRLGRMVVVETIVGAVPPHRMCRACGRHVVVSVRRPRRPPVVHERRIDSTPIGAGRGFVQRVLSVVLGLAEWGCSLPLPHDG